MTDTPSCPGRDALERLLLGTLPDAEVQALEGHVALCPRCLEVVRGVRSEDALTEAVRAGGRAEDLPRDEGLIALLCRLPQDVLPTAPLAGDTPPPAGER